MFYLNSKYIFRLDDACPTMRVENWQVIEEIFDDFGIKPIIGVIPDCRDAALNFGPPCADFWEMVSRWKSKGWEIVMHGFHHKYHNIVYPNESFLGLSTKSEFVGLSLLHQAEMLANARDLMASKGLPPRAFMAPSHAFDLNTLKALKVGTDIRIITDGHSLFPFKHLGFTWIPQQLWKFRDLPFGYWCICLHPNTMNSEDIEDLRSCLRSYSRRFVDFETFLAAARNKNFVDKIFESIYKLLLRLK